MPFPSCVPTLTDDVVTLRAHRREDLPAIVEQSRDPASQRWTTVPRDYTLSDAEFFLELITAGWENPDGNHYWAIDWTDDAGRSHYGGTLDLRPATPKGVASIGFGLHPAARGRGIMARAVRLVAEHFFTGGGRRIFWSANEGNFASWRVAWACGFTFHGGLPQWLAMPGGSAANAWLASLSVEDSLTPHTAWQVPPVLRGERVTLRPWRDEDCDAVEKADQPAHYMPAAGVPTPDTFDSWLLRRRLSMSRDVGINWCIADARSDRALGEVLLFVHDGTLSGGDEAELGYQLFPSARGQGLAAEAAALVLQHAVTPAGNGGLGLRRLKAVTASDNAASIATLRSLGFTRWGHEQAATAPDGSISPADHWEFMALE